MKKLKTQKKLPTNWEKREELRNKGQFWTPDWIAEAMVEYVIEDSKLLFDPATGEGSFYNALRKITSLKKYEILRNRY